MSTRNRTRKQAARDRALLKRLVNSGTYRGKIDLRKAPSKYQLQKIAELATSKKRGGAKTKRAKQSLPPKHKVPGATIRRKRISEREVRELSPTGGDYRLTTYALPFLRKGQEEPEWRRFTASGLTKFINEYKADDPEGGAEWKRYAVRETWTFETKTEKSDFRKEADVYFSGVRISEPQGGISQKRRPNKKGHRGSRKRSRK